MGTRVQTSLLEMSCDGAWKDREGHRDTLVGGSRARSKAARLATVIQRRQI